MQLTALQVRSLVVLSRAYFADRKLADCTAVPLEGSSVWDVFFDCCETVEAQKVLLEHLGDESDGWLLQRVRLYVHSVLLQLDRLYTLCKTDPDTLYQHLSYALAHSAATVSASRCVRVDWKPHPADKLFWSTALSLEPSC
jgi:hypothetical protein